MFHKYHLLKQIASFHEIQKITKMSFNIPLRHFINIIYMKYLNFQVFYFDPRGLHWPTYLESYCLGTKKYLRFIGGGNQSTWRKQPTCHKLQTNFII
jgi:hypothetical protein